MCIGIASHGTGERKKLAAGGSSGCRLQFPPPFPSRHCRQDRPQAFGYFGFCGFVRFGVLAVTICCRSAATLPSGASSEPTTDPGFLPGLGFSLHYLHSVQHIHHRSAPLTATSSAPAQCQQHRSGTQRPVCPSIRVGLAAAHMFTSPAKRSQHPNPRRVLPRRLYCSRRLKY